MTPPRMARVLVLSFFAGSVAPLAWPAGDYRAEIQEWRKRHDQEALAPHGPFAVVTRLIAKPGASTIGRDKTNDLVLPVEKAPARVGTLTWPGDDKATLRLEPGVTATMEGKTVSEVAITKPAIISVGQMRLAFRIRDSQLRVTVQDPDAPQRKEAKPPVWFPVDPHYRVTADWIAFPEPKTIRLPDSDGGSREWKSPGETAFTLNGESLKLQAVLTPNEKELSLFFRDATAGHETYGAGRYLETELPKNGKVVIDFNKAYNPFCAYNAYYVCPIPPKENHIKTHIAAGERNYPHPAIHSAENH